MSEPRRGKKLGDNQRFKSKQERKAFWKRRAWETEKLSGDSEVCKEDKVSEKAQDRKKAFLGQWG